MKKRTIPSLTFLALILFASAQLSSLAIAEEITQNLTVDILPLPNISTIKINEFVFDPETDWDGDGGVDIQDDEWVELYNPESSPVNLSGWTLFNHGGDDVLSGILDANSYLVILNPDQSLSNGGDFLNLTDQFGRTVDFVAYGNYNDGNLSDNAPGGSTTDENDECVARLPNGADTNVDSADFFKTKCTFEAENSYNLSPINITNLQSEPLCIPETEDLIVSANITGSIKNVYIALKTGGIWKNISLEGNEEGKYSFTINASEYIGGENVMWQFFADNPLEEITLGEINSQIIKHMSILTISPSDPNGDNGWYTTDPTFNLTNPDATELFYQWDSSSIITYSGQFGLEATPNNASQTGGMLELNFWSDVCTGEIHQTEILNLDVAILEIKNILPLEDAIIPANTDVLISAYIDEIHGGNSGVNLPSVTLSLDSILQTPTVGPVNSQDAEVSFLATGLPTGLHEVRITAEDNAGRFSQRIWTFIVSEVPDFNMTVYSNLDGIFSDRRIPLNITTNLKSEKIEIIDYSENNPRFKRLCRNCDEYGNLRKKLKTFKDGSHNITIRATGQLGQVIEQSFTFIVDSKKPKISSTSPRRGFASGLFEISFKEENPEKLTLFYGTSENNRSMDLNLSTCIEDRSKDLCEIDVNLTDFHSQEIEYWFEIMDIANNTDKSRSRKLNVDVISPEILFSNYTIDKRRVEFTYQIEEENFDKILYKDNNASNPRFRTLCSRLKDEGICKKKISFRNGEHYLDIRVQDDAGNFVEEQINFTI